LDATDEFNCTADALWAIAGDWELKYLLAYTSDVHVELFEGPKKEKCRRVLLPGVGQGECCLNLLFNLISYSFLLSLFLCPFPCVVHSRRKTCCSRR
jgi:hypothetical protein